MLFDRIKSNYLSKDFTKQIFDRFVSDKLILTYKLPENKSDFYSVTIGDSSDKTSKNNYLINRVFNEKINLSSIPPAGPFIIKNSPVKSSNVAIEKFFLTPELKNELEDINILKFVRDNYAEIDLAKLQNYDSNFLLSLVATINNFPDQTAAYFMVHYSLKNNVSLEIANMELDHLLPKILEKHPKIHALLKKCRQHCGSNTSGDCFLKKLLVSIPDSSEICVVFFVTFLSDVVYTRQTNLPLKNLYDHIAQNFREWNVFMKGVSKFPLSGDLI